MLVLMRAKLAREGKAPVFVDPFQALPLELLELMLSFLSLKTKLWVLL